MWKRESQSPSLSLHCPLSEKRCTGEETEATPHVTDLPCPTTTSQVTICSSTSSSATSCGSTNSSPHPATNTSLHRVTTGPFLCHQRASTVLHSPNREISNCLVRRQLSCEGSLAWGRVLCRSRLSSLCYSRDLNCLWVSSWTAAICSTDFYVL